jgi:hypothetical protein
VFVVSKGKLFSKLDDLEILLKDSVVSHLRLAVNNGNENVFCVTELAKNCDTKHKTDKTTEELVLLGRQVLSLKEKLGETSQGSIAERICWYCREWSHASARYSRHSHHSGTYLAQQFLDEIARA